MVPVIVLVGVGMFSQRDRMLDFYHAAYPFDPARAEALNDCAGNPNFNRFDSGDRAVCYARVYGENGPRSVGSAAGSPVPRPGNEMRRAEANSDYLRAAQYPVAPGLLTPTPHPVVHPILPSHHTVARHHPAHSHITAAMAATGPQ